MKQAACPTSNTELPLVFQQDGIVGTEQNITSTNSGLNENLTAGQNNMARTAFLNSEKKVLFYLRCTSNLDS